MDNVKCIGNETALDQCLYTEVVSSVSPVYPCFFIMFIRIYHCSSLFIPAIPFYNRMTVTVAKEQEWSVIKEI